MKLRHAALVSLSLLASTSAAGAQPHRPPPASAQPAVSAQASPEVEAEHARGIELRRRQRDAEARDVFRGIYERTREPRALARQAAAEAALGDWVAAEQHLASALQSATDPWITANRAGLESDLAAFRQHVGLLDVVSSTPHAELWLGGARAASLPLERPLRVRAGTLAVEVRARGFVSEVRTVDVPGGARATARETVNLTPELPRVTTPAVAVSASPLAPPRRVDDSRAAPMPVSRVVGLSLMGLGAVGVGVGIFGMVQYGSEVSRFNGDPACGTAALTSACQPVYDSGTSARTLGITGLAVGGAVMAGGLTLLLLSLRQAPRSPIVSVGAGATGVDVSVGGRF